MDERVLAVLFGVAVVAGATVSPSTASAQPRFAVEVEGGRNLGLTPYLRDVVYSDTEIRGAGVPAEESFQPFLADERSGWGNHFAARLISKGFQVGLTLRWFDVSQVRIHHRGETAGHPDSNLRPTRIRPDGTVDDTGVTYDPLDTPIDVPIDADKRANLFVFGVEAGYRLYLYRGELDVFAPLSGSLVVTHLGRQFAPFRPGLDFKSGVSASFDFVSVLSINLGPRLHGLVTPNYWNRSDAARRAAELDRSTESALFSSQVYLSLDVALEFAIR